tara:strand:+ start:1632 stop:1832 length:201 start_codon:yes stop_codon:yes gene_type:complete
MKMPCRVTDDWDKRQDYLIEIEDTSKGFKVIDYSHNCDVNNILYETYEEAHEVLVSLIDIAENNYD